MTTLTTKRTPILDECLCDHPYPNPEHGEVCVNCGDAIMEKAEKKLTTNRTSKTRLTN
jgi:hypothetical protein